MKLALELSRCLVAAAVAAGLLCARASQARSDEWRFTVRLDDRPVGIHRFVVEMTDGGSMRVESEARFDVTLLGVPLYRYRHHAVERWSNGCLSGIEARTDDNGNVTEVRGRSQEDRFDLRVVDGQGAASAAPVAPCLMSFAYWNPALSRQARLLDPGSGRIETVAMGTPSAVPPDLAAGAVGLRGLRIAGLPHPIDVWYEGGRWIGLDTIVGGGRRLSYRLN